MLLQYFIFPFFINRSFSHCSTPETYREKKISLGESKIAQIGDFSPHLLHGFLVWLITTLPCSLVVTLELVHNKEWRRATDYSLSRELTLLHSLSPSLQLPSRPQERIYYHTKRNHVIYLGKEGREGGTETKQQTNNQTKNTFPVAWTFEELLIKKQGFFYKIVS